MTRIVVSAGKFFKDCTQKATFHYDVFYQNLVENRYFFNNEIFFCFSVAHFYVIALLECACVYQD